MRGWARGCSGISVCGLGEWEWDGDFFGFVYGIVRRIRKVGSGMYYLLNG